MSDFSKKLHLTIQETHRNITRLVDSGFIEKNHEGLFSLTDYGKLIFKQMSYFQFIDEHKQFFEAHSLSIPSKFILRLGSLKNCEEIHNVTTVLETLKKLETNAEKQIKIIVAQAWEGEGKILLEKAKKGIRIRTIFGYNSILPTEVDLLKKRIDSYSKNGIVEQRMIKKVDVSVFIADDKAAISFPNKKGQIDLISLLVGADNDFVEWCNDLFEELWLTSRPFDITKVQRK